MAVSTQSRNDISRMLNKGHRAPRAVCKRLAWVNHWAAQAPNASGRISPDCTRMSLILGPNQWSGESLMHSDRLRTDPVIVPHISGGMDTTAYVDDAARQLWKDEGWSGHPQAPAPARTRCAGAAPARA